MDLSSALVIISLSCFNHSIFFNDGSIQIYSAFVLGMQIAVCGRGIAADDQLLLTTIKGNDD